MQVQSNSKQALRILASVTVFVRPAGSGGFAWRIPLPAEVTAGKGVALEGRASTEALAYECGARSLGQLTAKWQHAA